MEYIIKGRKPELALRYFEEISAIPRGSHNEEAVSKYVQSEADRLGLWSKRDDTNNVVVKKPASAGCEGMPPLLMQAHMDMVCEKNRDTVHDFEKDGLKLKLNGSILTADGTTLGSDDGHGVSYMLSFMAEENDSFPHPPLEFCFTTCEEVGFDGAMNLDYSCFDAKNMIGLDAGPEGETYTTCAGGQEINIYRDLEFVKSEGAGVSVEVRGLLGGHSALNIADEKANANKLMGRILHRLEEICKVNIVAISGGSKINSIPREADCTFYVPKKDVENVKKELSKIDKTLADEYRVTDPDVKVKFGDMSSPLMMTDKVSTDIISALYCIPNGVRTMSKEIEGLPIISTNMGVVTQTDSQVIINTFIRSSDKTMNEDYCDTICTISSLCGMRPVAKTPFPGWKYEANSKMRELATKLYKDQTGKDMEYHAVHGGLELGLFVENIPGIDITCIGPDAGDVHTVTEWMDLDSYERTYNLLKMMMESLSKNI